jgi:septin family protein
VITDSAVAHRGELKQAITAILYFLPPHRTKPVDWIILAVLSQLVAVIPIIAKADTMTADELDRYRWGVCAVRSAAGDEENRIKYNTY